MDLGGMICLFFLGVLFGVMGRYYFLYGLHKPPKLADIELGPEYKCKNCGDYEVDHDGLCYYCFENSEMDQRQLGLLKEMGHSHHCASRQIWGDGECECGLYKSGLKLRIKGVKK